MNLKSIFGLLAFGYFISELFELSFKLFTLNTPITPHIVGFFLVFLLGSSAGLFFFFDGVRKE